MEWMHAQCSYSIAISHRRSLHCCMACIVVLYQYYSITTLTVEVRVEWRAAALVESEGAAGEHTHAEGHDGDSVCEGVGLGGMRWDGMHACG